MYSVVVYCVCSAVVYCVYLTVVYCVYVQVVNCKIGKMQGELMAVCQMQTMSDALSCVREMHGLPYKNKLLDVKYMVGPQCAAHALSHSRSAKILLFAAVARCLLENCIIIASAA